MEAHINLHWLLIVTLVPLSCVCMASLGLLLGTSFEPRNLGLMFGFIVLPITFLGGTYYQWTRLAPVKVGPVHWLQIIVLINPLIYINDGMRAAFTDAAHMHLYIIYPAIVAFSVIFLALGLRNFRRQGAGLSQARPGATSVSPPVTMGVQHGTAPRHATWCATNAAIASERNHSG